MTISVSWSECWGYRGKISVIPGTKMQIARKMKIPLPWSLATTASQAGDRKWLSVVVCFDSVSSSQEDSNKSARVSLHSVRFQVWKRQLIGQAVVRIFAVGILPSLLSTSFCKATLYWILQSNLHAIVASTRLLSIGRMSKCWLVWGPGPK